MSIVSSRNQSGARMPCRVEGHHPEPADPAHRPPKMMFGVFRGVAFTSLELASLPHRSWSGLSGCSGPVRGAWGVVVGGSHRHTLSGPEGTRTQVRLSRVWPVGAGPETLSPWWGCGRGVGRRVPGGV